MFQIQNPQSCKWSCDKDKRTQDDITMKAYDFGNSDGEGGGRALNKNLMLSHHPLKKTLKKEALLELGIHSKFYQVNMWLLLK